MSAVIVTRHKTVINVRGWKALDYTPHPHVEIEMATDDGIERHEIEAELSLDQARELAQALQDAAAEATTADQEAV